VLHATKELYVARDDRQAIGKRLPPDVKNSVTVLSFKIKLEGFKKDMISKRITNDCFF